MDYQALLEKYIAYVLDVEGSDFIGPDGDQLSWRGEAIVFTAAEKNALIAAAKQES